MLKSKIAKMLAGVTALVASGTAHAGNYRISLIATGFPYYNNPNIIHPVDPVYFNGLIGVDTSHDIDPTTLGLTIQSFNLSYSTQFAYDSDDDTLIIGTNIVKQPNGSYSIPPAPSSWFVAIGNAFGGSPFIYNFVQMTPLNNQQFFTTYATTDVTMQITRLDAPAVPEPGVWSMMLLGFGGIGYAARRRKRGGVRALAA